RPIAKRQRRGWRRPADGPTRHLAGETGFRKRRREPENFARLSFETGACTSGRASSIRAPASIREAAVLTAHFVGRRGSARSLVSLAVQNRHCPPSSRRGLFGARAML